MMRREKSNYMIQSVSHALDVLEQFRGGGDEIGVTELSKRLKLHKNNVFRLLATLEARGYIEQNKATENYRLGLKCLQLGQAYVRQIGFLHQAQSTLQVLAEKTRESAFVALRKGLEVVPLDFVESKSTVRVVSFLGDSLPLHCTAPGKVHLAFDSEEELRDGLPETLARYTDKTIVDRPMLLRQIQEINDEGYAVDLGEFIEDVRCVAVPVRDHTRSLVGSLSVAGPAHRLTQEKIEEEIIPLILRDGNDLSKRLGYHQ
ncbi:MAG: IclR family transcriptional regulator [Candidatus Binatia bacterium]